MAVSFMLQTVAITQLLSMLFQKNGEAIERIQLISTEGDIPRDFDLDPSEDFIVVANQDSDNLTLYRRNQETGLLEMIQKDVAVPECVCVFYLYN